MKGMPEQHTVEPAEGYKCALNLLPDTKFTWKRNIPENFKSEFQIASDPTFKNIVYSAPVNSPSLKGVNIDIGTYYWRLKSSSTTDETELITPAKTLNIIGNLDEADQSHWRLSGHRSGGSADRLLWYSENPL